MITSWQIGEKVEAGKDFLFLGSKVTMDGDCSHEVKRCLLLGRKAMTNLDSILKSKDITLLTKGHSQSYSFCQYLCMHVRAEIEKELYTEQLMPLNYCAGKDPEKSPGLQGYQTIQSKRKSTLNTHWKD